LAGVVTAVDKVKYDLDDRTASDADVALHIG
jgi:hypothetical protein